MQIKEIKETLRSYKTLADELQQIKDRHAELRSRLINPQAQVITDMPRGGDFNANKILDGIANIEELDRRYTAQQKKVMESIKLIDEMIFSLKGDYKQVVILRHIKGHSWVKVGRLMYVSDRWAQKLHGQALKEIEKNYKGDD